MTERLRSLGIDVVDRPRRRPTSAGPTWSPTRPRSTADNPELVEARRRGVPVLTRAETLAAIAARRRCIAVAGTHGKTTTASMLALILVEAGLHPSFLIGGDVNEIGTNAVWDTGEWIVVEADESDGTFLHLVPDIAVVTNVEADHLDHYGSFDAVRTAFAEFLASARHRVVGSDDPEARAIGRAVGADLVGLGRRRHPHHRRRGHRSQLGRLRPAGSRPVRWWPTCRCRCPGLHNAKNAAVADGRRPRTPVPPRRPRPGRWPGSGAWPAASSSAASSTASPTWTTTPICPPRSGPPWPPPATAPGAGWSPCSSRTATRGRPRSAPTSPGPSTTPTWWC